VSYDPAQQPADAPQQSSNQSGHTGKQPANGAREAA
jgi:hypothetical protein